MLNYRIMKAIKLLFLMLVSGLMLTSCSDQDNNDNSIALPQLMEQNEIWYVDYARTQGSGNVPFLSKAFTISFRNGTLMANNNLVGIGSTGNGFGVVLGYYSFGQNVIYVDHNIYGNYTLEVTQLSSDEIKVYDRYQNVSYYLIAYQRSTFDYDRVFYENMSYFLQEYRAWEKVYTSQAGSSNAFDNENYLQFTPNGSYDRFRSSNDNNGLGVNSIYWDYSGNYIVGNTNSLSQKILTLNYNSQGNEMFRVSVINDSRIRLYHIASGTTYEFVGRSFVPILRQSAANRVKK